MRWITDFPFKQPVEVPRETYKGWRLILRASFKAWRNVLACLNASAKRRCWKTHNLQSGYILFYEDVARNEYSVIRQPIPKLSKVNAVDVIFLRRGSCLHEPQGRAVNYLLFNFPSGFKITILLASTKKSASTFELSPISFVNLTR